MLRYTLLLDKDQGASPEKIVLSDRSLQVRGPAWPIIFMLDVYLAG